MSVSEHPQLQPLMERALTKTDFSKVICEEVRSVIGLLHPGEITASARGDYSMSSYFSEVNRLDAGIVELRKVFENDVRSYVSQNAPKDLQAIVVYVFEKLDPNKKIINSFLSSVTSDQLSSRVREFSQVTLVANMVGTIVIDLFSDNKKRNTKK